ncbi:hypothetical protein [Phytohabitans flavus]|uniref:hypothetical protein n=1 Tax=Phytohabitans flavus TaxID=1076124 RepID=UPI002F965985
MIRLGVPRLPAIHWPSVRGRGRADAGPLALVAAVVVVVTLLAGAAPPLLRAAADDAVQDAARTAGRNADVTAHARWPYDDAPGGGRARTPHLAADIEDFRDQAVGALDPGLRAVLGPPVAMVTSPTLKVTDGSLLRTFQLAYLLDERGAYSDTQVSWIAGGPPAPAVPSDDASVTAPYDGPPWPVQVGLSEADAAALDLGPGDRIPLADQYRRVKNVVVSGIFRATDSNDPTWRLAPGCCNRRPARTAWAPPGSAACSPRTRCPTRGSPSTRTSSIAPYASPPTRTRSARTPPRRSRRPSSPSRRPPAPPTSATRH